MINDTANSPVDPTDLSDYQNLNSICETIAGWLTHAAPEQPAWSVAQWTQFRRVSQVHGVAPLLHATLKECSWLDDPVRMWLAEQYSFNRQRLAKMQTELAVILAEFSQNNVPLLPLKGSVLTATLYEDAGLRPMADLDLLIHPQDFEQSANLLRKLGYEQNVVHWKHTEFNRPNNRQVVSKTVEHPDNPRGLELHLYCRETFGGPTVDLTGLMWHHAKPQTLLGERAMQVEWGALWLHLLVHATYHMWQGRGRLIHLVDLARLTPYVTNPSEWLTLIDARFTYPCLVMLKRYFPTPTNEKILTEQRTKLSAGFQRWVASLDLVNTSYLNPQGSGLYFFKALKFSEGRPKEIGQALRFALLPSLEEIALDHPKLATSPVAWLGYFLLPFDWIKRLIGRIS
jgi:hypothetical protein